MFYEEILEGRYVDLISATVKDVEFTWNIRRDPNFAIFFPKFDNTLEQQKAWICSQRNEPGDYFFVIWDKEGNRIGVIGLYNIKKDECEAGRIAVRGNAFQSIEAQMLSFTFAFDILNVDKTISYIYADNERALRFSKLFGGNFDEPRVYKYGERPMIRKVTKKEQFYDTLEKIKKMIYRDERGNYHV